MRRNIGNENGVDTSSQYLEWNDRLAKYYFNQEMAGREVLLYANKQIIDSVGEGLGDVSHFISSVKDGPPWAKHTGLCQKALQAYEGWRFRGLAYPPYIALLVLFVLAEDIEGRFAPQSYYPKLNRLLNLQGENAPSSFYRMIELWKDLEEWSREDRHEEWGRFVFRIRGEWRHVGIPLSQTLLSHDERANLTLIFDKADVDPTDPPAVGVMNRLLLYYGSRMHLLQNRTLNVLGSTGLQDSALKNALLEFVLGELSDWDGASINVLKPEREGTKESRTGLRICLHEDTLSRRFEAYFRFKTNHKMPESDLNLTWLEGSKAFICFESNENWSSPLKEQPTSRNFNASSVNWKEDLQLIDVENNWRVRLKGARVRIFTQGARENLPDWVESHHLERNTDFLVATCSDMTDKIKNWGSESCESFYEKGHEGLPAEWSIYHGKNVSKSCDGVDLLTLSDLLQIKLVGGIKTGRGNTYLKFGLPKVILDNVSGSEQLRINDSPVARATSNIPVWELPEDLPLYQPLRIEVYNDSSEDPVQTRVITVEEPRLPVTFVDLPKRGANGEIVTENDTDYVVGPLVIDSKVDTRPTFPGALPTHLSSKITFIGARPGEIKDWPNEALPGEWHPVWAVIQTRHKLWDVHFCGSLEHLNENHYPGIPVSDRKLIKKWREAIWIRRKITRPPSLVFLSRIWKRYVEAAKNA